MTKKRVWLSLVLAIVAILCVSCLISCGGDGQVVGTKFDDFTLSLVGELPPYFKLNSTVTFSITESAGSPDAYKVYVTKGEDAEYLFGSYVKAQNISIVLDTTGTIVVRVAPEVDGMIYSGKKVTLEVRDSTAQLTSLFVYNNVVDLYDNHAILDIKELRYEIEPKGIYLVPEYEDTERSVAEKNRSYTIDYTTNVLTARYPTTDRDVPPVLSFYQSGATGAPSAVANVYIRITKDNVKKTLENFIVAYPGQFLSADKKVTYKRGDWVPLQAVPAAGQSDADDYAVYRVNKETGEEIALNGTDELEIKTIGDKTKGDTVTKYYCVKVTETNEAMEIKFNAAEGGIEMEGITASVKVPLSASAISPTEVEITEYDRIDGGKKVKTLCLDEKFTIKTDVFPSNTTYKSLGYEYDDDYITVDGAGEITPKAATPDAEPVCVTVYSDVDDTVKDEIYVYVANIRKDDVKLMYNSGEVPEEIVAEIGNVGNISFTVSAGDLTYNVKWYKIDGDDSSFVTNNRTYTFDDTQVAGDKTIRADILLDPSGVALTIVRYCRVRVVSAIRDVTDFAARYRNDSTVTLTADTDLTGNVSWKWQLMDASKSEVGSPTSGIDVQYMFTETGEYSFRLELFRDGTLLETKNSDMFIVVSSDSMEIINLHVNAYRSGDSYLPFIKWYLLKTPSSDFTVTVEIKKGAGNWRSFSSSDPDYQNCFFADGFKIPDNSVATIADSFSYRVKTSISNSYETGTYNGEINDDEAKPYIEKTLSNGKNLYFNNLREIADVINYISVMRPTNEPDVVSVTTVGDVVSAEFTAFFALDMETYPGKEYYHFGTDETNVSLARAMKVMQSVFECYGMDEVAKTGYSVKPNMPGTKIVTVSLELRSDVSISKQPTETTPVAEFVGATHYAEAPRGNGEFPIYERTRTLNVTTSKQLLFAVMNGYKPVPEPGSHAAIIYSNARKALGDIISDTMTDRQKVTAIFDWLSENVTYDDVAANEYKEDWAAATTEAQRNAIAEDARKYKCFHLEGVFLDDNERFAVCDGISKAFALMCAIEEIPVIIVSGTGITSNGSENHAWNIVLVEGEWCNIDATWGRTTVTTASNKYSTVSYRYFLASAANFDPSHLAVGEKPSTTEKSKLGDEAYKVTSETELDAAIDEIVAAASRTTSKFSAEIIYFDGFTITKAEVMTKLNGKLNGSLSVTDNSILIYVNAK